MKKYTVNIVFWLIMIPLLIGLLSFAGQENKQKTCQGFRVSIDYGDSDYLFTAKDIEKQVISTFDTLKGVLVKDIVESDIEREIERNPFVLNAEVYTTINGQCIAEVEQRHPIVHFMDRNGKGAYADINGVLMPGNFQMPARVMVASGYFSLDTLNPALQDIRIRDIKHEGLQEMFRIAQKVENDPLLQTAVEQIYRNKDEQYELATKLGQHRVLIGEARKLDEKFSKLNIFYKKALEKGGWKNYHALNLVYEDQIVCKKN